MYNVSICSTSPASFNCSSFCCFISASCLVLNAGFIILYCATLSLTLNVNTIPSISPEPLRNSVYSFSPNKLVKYVLYSSVVVSGASVIIVFKPSFCASVKLPSNNTGTVSIFNLSAISFNSSGMSIILLSFVTTVSKTYFLSNISIAKNL